MRATAEVEVRWKIGRKTHRVVVKRGSKISAIILNGPALPDAPVPPAPEFQVVSDLGPGEGPFVCYEINGQLHCW
jgi:hypothetical protein